MVGVSTHPPGVSGKSIPTLGANATQSPIGDTSPASIAPEANLNSCEVFRNLTESIEARNRMVRKLNASKRYRRLDRNILEVVSDDEVEVDMPNINSYMN